MPSILQLMVRRGSHATAHYSMENWHVIHGLDVSRWGENGLSGPKQLHHHGNPVASQKHTKHEGKIGNISHPGHVEIFISHHKFSKFFYHTECRTCFNITLCNRPLIYHFFVEALVKYTYFVFGAVILTHFVLFTNYFITRMHPW